MTPSAEVTRLALVELLIRITQSRRIEYPALVRHAEDTLPRIMEPRTPKNLNPAWPPLFTHLGAPQAMQLPRMSRSADRLPQYSHSPAQRFCWAAQFP